MSYYWLNWQEILQYSKRKKDKRKQKKEKERYSKEKAAECCAQNKEAIKEKPESIIKTCHKKKKTRLKSTKEKSIKNWFSIKKKRWKINNFLLFP